MGMFRPKLEPGEAVVLRGPRRPWYPMWALLLGFVAMMIFHAVADYPGLSWTIFIPVFLLGTAAAAFPFSAFARWRVFVTDRRLLVRNKALRWRMDEIRIGEIETVRHDIPANAIVVHGGGREIRFDPDLVDLHVLKQALDRREALA